MKILLAILLVFTSSIFLHAEDCEITTPLVIFDDFEDGDSGDWGFFGGNNAGGGGGVLTDRPKEGSFYFSTGWGGAGTGSGFYGGSFKNLDNNNQITLPDDPWLCFWVLNQSDATANAYTLEVTIREDLDGNGWFNGEEDSFRLDTDFQSSDFNDEWILISAPISSLINLNTGGDGIFNGAVDEVVFVITGVEGGSGSTVEVDFDQFAFCSGNPCPADPIPTMSQWALFILGLCITTLAVVTIRNRVLVVN